LEQLGYLLKSGPANYVISNRFLREWLVQDLWQECEEEMVTRLSQGMDDSTHHKAAGWRRRPATAFEDTGGKSHGSVTWLHVSDLHYRSSQDYNIGVVEKALLADVALMVTERSLVPDFVAVSGDLAYSAQAEQYAWIERFMDRLMTVARVTNRECLLVVPGNHDVDREAIDPILAKGILQHLTSGDAVSEFLGPDRDRSHAFAKFAAYRRFFNRLFNGIAHFDEENYFWARRLRIGRRAIGVLGLNSAWMSGFNKGADGAVDDHGRLIVGERQVDDAIARLEQCGGADIWIALMHHPLGYLNDAFDAGPVESLLRKRCDFILRGHLHRANMIQEFSLEGETVIIPAGACYDRRDRPGNGYNFVHLDFETSVGTIHLRRYSDRRREWLPDVEATGENRRGQLDFRLPRRR
jgi:hypothetical protein